MTRPILEARAVSRTFTPRGGGTPVEAVRGVSVAVFPGELVVVAGPSGSGKTTLLHLLAAIDSPTTGTVLIEGAEVGRLTRKAQAATRLQRLGLLFSEHNLSPALTVAENVDLPLALRGLAAAERAQRVESALSRLGVGRLSRRFPDALSTGEQQRVAIARAVAGDPAALIADEPTAHLDSEAAEGLLQLLQDLVAERGMAAVVASHDPAVIQRAGRVVRLRDGAAHQE
ncbi:MAG TPA: ABC transporter ATP-binding protein [Candidatus Binatia bacterium]|jgi:putative ABC transport system ATP-binding protein